MAERTSTLTAGGHKSICVYDGQLKLLARLESWVSLVWPERYNVYSGVQGAQLELHASTDLQALCRPDRYLWLVGSDRRGLTASCASARRRPTAPNTSS